LYEICKKTENCVEADYKIINGKEIYNCTKCLNEYVLTYKKKGDIFACKYDDNNMPTFLHILLCKNHI